MDGQTENETLSGKEDAIERIQIALQNKDWSLVQKISSFLVEQKGLSPLQKVFSGDTYYQGDLTVEGNQIRELPEGLTVDGNLHVRLYKKHTSQLPKNLTVKGSLYSSGNIKISEGTTIEKDFFPSGYRFLSLPKGLKISGTLGLSESRVRELPEDIQIGGLLSLISSDIEELPDNLSVGSLTLNSANLIKKLPDNLQVRNSLDLRHTNLKSLPKSIRVGGDVYLPEGIQHVHYEVYIRGKIYSRGGEIFYE